MRKLSLLIMSIFFIGTFLLLSGCTTKTYVCLDGSTAKSPQACLLPTTHLSNITNTTNMSVTQEQVIQKEAPIPSNVTFPLDSQELANIISLKAYQYVAAPTSNKYNDQSSIRNIAGTKKFEAFMQATINYVQTNKYKDATLFVKVIGTGISGDLSKVVYEGYLWPGEQTFNFSTILQTQAANPRIKFCFGFTPDFDPYFDESPTIACFTKRLNAPEHNLFLNKDKLTMRFNANTIHPGEAVQLSQTITMENDGSVPTTFFIALPPANENYSIQTNNKAVFLEPKQAKTILITTTWQKGNETIYANTQGGIYTAAYSCNPSIECLATARYSKDIEILVRE